MFVIWALTLCEMLFILTLLKKYSYEVKPTLKAAAAMIDRVKAIGKWNLNRLARSPRKTGFGRDIAIA